MELQPVAKFGLGASLLIVSQSLSLFSLFRGVDWLRINYPRAFTVLSNPPITTTLLLAGVGMCAWGLYEVWKQKSHAGRSPNTSPRPAVSTTHGPQSNAIIAPG